MGETEKMDAKISKDKRGRRLKAFDPELLSFFVQLPQKIEHGLKIQLSKFAKRDRRGDSTSLFPRKEKGTSAWEVDLKKQMQAWKENPSWNDQPPEIKVTVPKGSLCNLNVDMSVGLPPDAVYNIVIDPDNKRVFKNIKEVISRKVLLDEGQRQVVEVEQAAIWKFLWWSGVISVHVVVDQNREDHSMKFTQVKTGFMKKFEGCWRVEPLFVDAKSCHPFKPKTWEDYYSCTGGKGRVGSRVSLEQLIQPALVPPPPISWYLRGITAKTTEMLIHDLLAEAARIREEGTINSEEKEDTAARIISNEFKGDKSCNVKERWAIHRRNAKQRPRGLVTEVK